LRTCVNVDKHSSGKSRNVRISSSARKRKRPSAMIRKGDSCASRRSSKRSTRNSKTTRPINKGWKSKGRTRRRRRRRKRRRRIGSGHQEARISIISIRIIIRIYKSSPD